MALPATNRDHVETSLRATRSELSVVRILNHNVANKLRDCELLMRRGAPVDDVLGEVEPLLDETLERVRAMRDPEDPIRGASERG